MKKIVYLSLIGSLTLAGSLALAGCSAAIDAKKVSVESYRSGEKFTSKTASKTYALKSEVSAVTNTTFADVEYVRGTANELIVTGPETEIENILVRTSGNGVMISCIKNYPNGTPKIKIKVTTPALEDFTLTGPGNFTAKSVQSPLHFRMRLTGAGKAQIASIQSPSVELLLSGAGGLEVADIEGSSTNITLTGAGDVEVASIKTSVAILRLPGAGDIEIDRLSAPSTEILLSGAGDIEIDKIETSTLTANSTGAGNIRISGEAADMRLISTGAGNIDATGMKSGSTSKLQRGVGVIKD